MRIAFCRWFKKILGNLLSRQKLKKNVFDNFKKTFKRRFRNFRLRKEWRKYFMMATIEGTKNFSTLCYYFRVQFPPFRSFYQIFLQSRSLKTFYFNFHRVHRTDKKKNLEPRQTACSKYFSLVVWARWVEIIKRNVQSKKLASGSSFLRFIREFRM